MKLKLLLIFCLASVSRMYAQDYQISFSGSGASNTVDSVWVENVSQCTFLKIGGKDILQLTSSVGMNEESSSGYAEMDISPNPMQHQCFIHFDVVFQGNYRYILSDIQGKILMSEQQYLSAGQHSYCISDLKAGIYLLKIYSDQFSYQSKLISTSNTASDVSFTSISDTHPSTTGLIKASHPKNKLANAIVDMQYTAGNLLKITGISGKFKTVYTITPTYNQTLTFDFVRCTDVDSISYPVVKIGTQLWMAENLKTKHYRNGIAIPEVPLNTDWRNLTSAAYCYYENNPDTAKIFGLLYNWFAVADTQKLCPLGWHVPSDADFTTLSNFYLTPYVTGGKLKDKCSGYWNSPNSSASNTSGFSALPGGYRDYFGPFDYLYKTGVWWSTTENDPTSSWYRSISYQSSEMYRYNGQKLNGNSVRCIKD